MKLFYRSESNLSTPLRGVIIVAHLFVSVGAATTCSAQGTSAFACENGIDDDSDGLVDYYYDPGCSSYQDNDESNGKAQCQDGIDNDNDGLIDVAQDPGCSSAYDNDEVVGLTQCQNGKDDDGDGLTDWKDPGCADPSDNDETNVPFKCQNGFDDDGDGLIDLKDPDCENNPCKDSEGTPPTIRVTPLAECVDVKQDGTLVAHFGYLNEGSTTINVPVGPQNQMSGDSQDRGQTTVFLSGAVSNSFVVTFPSTQTLKWTVGGKSAEASIATKRCEGSRIDCINTDNSVAQRGLDSTAKRQQLNVAALSKRILAASRQKTLTADARSYSSSALTLYVQQWEDVWGRFPQVSQSCSGCSAMDMGEKISMVQARSNELENLSKQATRTLKRARGGKLRTSDKKLLATAATLNRKFQEYSKKLPRFEASCR